MSFFEWVYTEEYMNSISNDFYDKFHGHRFKGKWLVCASNRDNARIAVENMLNEGEGEIMILTARIENLIVGD